MAVGLIAGQSRRHLLERKLGEERDAVEGLLPVHRNIVAERLERLAREGLIHALGLLQDNDVWPPLRKPSGQIVDPLLDGIDVPGRDAHLWRNKYGVRSCGVSRRAPRRRMTEF